MGAIYGGTSYVGNQPLDFSKDIYPYGEINGGINGGINSLGNSLREVYFVVKNNPGIKAKQVAEMRGRSESTVSKQLNDLIRKGFIVYLGAKKTGGYHIV